MQERLKRLLWFAGLWAAGVVCVLALAFVIRSMIGVWSEKGGKGDAFVFWIEAGHRHLKNERDPFP
jgi:hypothetical protein